MEIDLRCHRAEDVGALIAEGHDLLGCALRMGRPVYERDGYWSGLTEY